MDGMKNKFLSFMTYGLLILCSRPIAFGFLARDSFHSILILMSKFTVFIINALPIAFNSLAQGSFSYALGSFPNSQDLYQTNI